ncbi:MAG TPA: c-type cytochrome [Anaerolineaceae bacterium]|nr:c-type cytochrome [Anaerolineaceae bacterium]
MNKDFLKLLAALVLATIVLAACGGAPATPAATPLPTPPAPYAGMTNPLKGNTDAVSAGKDLFTAQCVSCHGDDAKGDGPAASALNPKPANLVEVVPNASDAFLYWRIAEGGGFAPFNSAMPAHKDTLSQQQIWQLVTYLQSLK